MWSHHFLYQQLLTYYNEYFVIYVMFLGFKFNTNVRVNLEYRTFELKTCILCHNTHFCNKSNVLTVMLKKKTHDHQHHEYHVFFGAYEKK
jgi:hypothetical protein